MSLELPRTLTQADRELLREEVDRLRLACGTSDLDILRSVWRQVSAFVNDVLETPKDEE